MLALTATATRKVLADICRAFRIDPECAIRTGFYRANLTLLTTPTTIAHRDALLLDRLRTRRAGRDHHLRHAPGALPRMWPKNSIAPGSPPAPTTRAWKTTIAPACRIGSWRRQAASSWPRSPSAWASTRRDIRYVYHYNLPKSLENYSQEIGRAGRDGEPSTCELLYCTDDLNVLQNFVYGDTPTRGAVRSFVREVLSLGDQFDVSTYDLSTRTTFVCWSCARC